MKYLLILFYILFSTTAYAHHSQDHMMLSGDTAHIIATTQQGIQNNDAWILWSLLFIFLLAGFIRLWTGRK